MVNSRSAHLVGEWVEAQTLQGVVLEETILAEPKGWQGGRDWSWQPVQADADGGGALCSLKPGCMGEGQHVT